MPTRTSGNTKSSKSPKSPKSRKTRKSSKSPKSPKSPGKRTPSPEIVHSEPVIHVDLRQILISVPIEKAVKDYDVNVDTSVFKKSNQPHGFGLSRMENMMSIEFDELLAKEPVQVKPAKTSAGKPMGVRIDGKMVPLYDIVNGRHRVARAIIEKRDDIPAIVIRE